MDFIPGAPNVGVNQKKIVFNEVIDSGAVNFHHAALADIDDELNATTEITQVVPYLFIGSWDNAVDLDLLKQKNIRHVLNVTELKKKPDTLKHMTSRGINHNHCSIENVPDANLRAILNPTYTFIKHAIDQRQNVMVHCHQGLSTSVAVVAYYILKNFYAQRQSAKNMLTLVLKKIREKRGYIDVNFGFLEQLEDAEAELSHRPVVDNESLSIRRNKELKNRLNSNMAVAVREDRAAADKTWITTHKIRY